MAAGSQRPLGPQSTTVSGAGEIGADPTGGRVAVVWLERWEDGPITSGPDGPGWATHHITNQLFHCPVTIYVHPLSSKLYPNRRVTCPGSCVRGRPAAKRPRAKRALSGKLCSSDSGEYCTQTTLGLGPIPAATRETQISNLRIGPALSAATSIPGLEQIIDIGFPKRARSDYGAVQCSGLITAVSSLLYGDVDDHQEANLVIGARLSWKTVLLLSWDDPMTCLDYAILPHGSKLCSSYNGPTLSWLLFVAPQSFIPHETGL
ncbi:hypothetical protein AHF37_00600 [Paragonimus kellicotti]|nr:hypothetical protein AHF37_00600 [Paragonimus kellicotti]